jgi:hypothetical protein
MSNAVEIPYSAFQAIEHELTEGPIGDGHTDDGLPFWIRRYKSPATGKIYDLVFVQGRDTLPRCIEMTPSG